MVGKGRPTKTVTRFYNMAHKGCQKITVFDFFKPKIAKKNQANLVFT